MFQILILFLSFTFEIYSLSCFVNNDPNKGLGCYRKHFDEAKNIIKNCSFGNNCGYEALKALDNGAPICKCDKEEYKLRCNWRDVGRVTQAFQVYKPNSKDDPKSPIFMEKCKAYLTQHQTFFKDCRGCDEKMGPQFWCANEPLIESWCTVNK